MADRLHGVLHLVQSPFRTERRGVRVISSRHLEEGGGVGVCRCFLGFTQLCPDATRDSGGRFELCVPYAANGLFFSRVPEKFQCARKAWDADDSRRRGFLRSLASTCRLIHLPRVSLCQARWNQKNIQGWWITVPVAPVCLVCLLTKRNCKKHQGVGG